MPPARFNPPPSWPVPRGWEPDEHWSPDPSWPPAPPGWQFWIAAEAEQRGRSSDRRRLGLAAAAAAVVVTLAAGTVAAVVWWPRDSSDTPLPEHMLAGTYPTSPDPAWTASAHDVAPGPDPAFISPAFGLTQYNTPGAVLAGDHVLVMTTSDVREREDRQLVSLSLTDGHVEWSAPRSLNGSCGRTLVDGMLPCLLPPGDTAGASPSSELQFVDTSDGHVASTVRLPFIASMVAGAGEDVYTVGWDGTPGLTVTKGTREDPLSGWKVRVPDGDCAGFGGGDALDVRIEDGVVWAFSSGGAYAVLRESDGSPLFDHAVTSAWLTDAGSAVGRACQQGTDADQWQTEVVDRSGTELFTSRQYLSRPTWAVYTGGEPAFLTQGGDGIDPRSGKVQWRVTSPAAGNGFGPHWIVGNVAVAPIDGGITAIDLRSGNVLWHSDHEVDTIQAVTDGQHLLAATVGGGIRAFDLTDGSVAWSIPPLTEYGHTSLIATTRGLLKVTAGQMTLLPFTGPAAPVPSVNGPSEAERRDGDTKMVTKCGREPTFEPEAVRTESDALVIRMKIVAHCPGGDVMSAPKTRITVTTSGQSVASAIFDLSTDPIVIPPGSTDEPSVTHEFRFPVGTFWRLPVSLDEAPTAGGSGQRGAVDFDATTILVECQQDGATSSGVDADSGTDASTASAPAAPSSGDTESASFDALRALANADRPFVTRQLADRWVPQLSSKRPGLVADGITWNNAETLREHLELRLKYPEVRLLWTGDWSTFSAPDFWVTIAGVTFPDSGAALAWCRDRGLDRDHCYAKLISTSHPVSGSTAFNP